MARGMSDEATVGVLADLPLFAGLKPAQLERLVKAGQARALDADQIAVAQGDYGTSMYFVLSGSARLSLKRRDGSSSVVQLLRRGDTFGELTLAGDRPYSATLIGNEPSLLFEIGRDGFTKVLAREAAVVQRLDHAYRRAAAFFNLHADSLFAGLPGDVLDDMVQSVRMTAFEKDAVIFHEGEEGDAFYIVWSGHVRVTRRTADGEEQVFAYVAEGDYFGEVALVERRARTATIIANDHVEVIRIERDDFLQITARYPQVVERLRERIAERTQQRRKVVASPTRALLIEGMLDSGAGFASNALVINLRLCTDCGACASACHELYGNSRLTRRGKTFVLPESHDPILMPNSCWHCKDPECMIGCPTDALRRGASGEIQVLEDRCIGCEICANRCPWGNITMADPQAPNAGSWLVKLLRRVVGRGKSAKPVAAARPKAVKCDLCTGKPQSACVMACPYGAIDRVDPNQFLAEALDA